MKKGGNGQREYYAAGKRAPRGALFPDVDVPWQEAAAQENCRGVGVGGLSVVFFFERGKRKHALGVLD